MGKGLFLELRNEVAKNWPKVEQVVRDRATKQEWKKVVSAIQKMFQDVAEEERPNFVALAESRKRKRG